MSWNRRISSDEWYEIRQRGGNPEAAYYSRLSETQERRSDEKKAPTDEELERLKLQNQDEIEDTEELEDDRHAEN